MNDSQSCKSSATYDERRNRRQKTKLRLLYFIRDTLERRLSATNASIETIKSQIERDLNDSTN